MAASTTWGSILATRRERHGRGLIGSERFKVTTQCTRTGEAYCKDFFRDEDEWEVEKKGREVRKKRAGKNGGFKDEDGKENEGRERIMEVGVGGIGGIGGVVIGLLG